MLLSKIQQAVSISRVNILQYCSASSSSRSANGRTNDLLTHLNKDKFLIHSTNINKKGKNTEDSFNNFHSLNLVDQLSCMTLCPKSYAIDFRAYSNNATSVLDNISNINDVSLPFNSISINKLEIDDIVEKSPIQDPSVSNNSPMKLHKGDLYWRRRRMRRHRLLRWRKRYKKLVLDRLQKRLNNREEKEKEDLKNAWQTFGLNNEPPPLSKGEIDSLSRGWEEQGILVGLEREEMMNFRKIEGIRKATDEGK